MQGLLLELRCAFVSNRCLAILKQQQKALLFHSLADIIYDLLYTKSIRPFHILGTLHHCR